MQHNQYKKKKDIKNIKTQTQTSTSFEKEPELRTSTEEGIKQDRRRNHHPRTEPAVKLSRHESDKGRSMQVQTPKGKRKRIKVLTKNMNKVNNTSETKDEDAYADGKSNYDHSLLSPLENKVTRPTFKKKIQKAQETPNGQKEAEISMVSPIKENITLNGNKMKQQTNARSS